VLVLGNVVGNVVQNVVGNVDEGVTIEFDDGNVVDGCVVDGDNKMFSSLDVVGGSLEAKVELLVELKNDDFGEVVVDFVVEGDVVEGDEEVETVEDEVETVEVEVETVEVEVETVEVEVETETVEIEIEEGDFVEVETNNFTSEEELSDGLFVIAGLFEKLSFVAVVAVVTSEVCA